MFQSGKTSWRRKNIDQGSDAKGMRILSKEEGGSGALAKRERKKGLPKGRVRPRDVNLICLGFPLLSPGKISYQVLRAYSVPAICMNP